MSAERKASAAVGETGAIYQIFIHNFTDEGTFKAAMPRLAAIRDLGFEWIQLTPFHPIGVEGRKGSRGSPYAIADYRAVDPGLGSLDDVRAFLEAAHGLGLRVMMDIVFNHASPDSRLARERPEWFMQEGLGPAASRGELEEPKPGARLGRKCEDWSDVVDFDYSSSPELWMELMSILAYWRDQGVDGFRCDVASLVPVDFWRQARQRVNQYDPGLRRERYPMLWLAESVHPAFLLEMRRKGFGVWSEPELHAVFDLSYDYDGWERLEKVWAGKRPASSWLEYLYAQETLYPAGARKIRFLENHDQMRASGRFVTGARLRAWTLAMLFVPGVALVYMGQECGQARKPDLFEKDPVDWASGDADFAAWFSKAFRACQRAKAEATFFSWRELGRGVFLFERRVTPEAAKPRYAALLNLEGWSGNVALPTPLRGRDLLDGEEFSLSESFQPPQEPVLFEPME